MIQIETSSRWFVRLYNRNAVSLRTKTDNKIAWMRNKYAVPKRTTVATRDMEKAGRVQIKSEQYRNLSVVKTVVTDTGMDELFCKIEHCVFGKFSIKSWKESSLIRTA